MAAASVSWHPGMIFSRSPAGGAFLCALNILLDVYADFFLQAIEGAAGIYLCGLGSMEAEGKKGSGLFSHRSKCFSSMRISRYTRKVIQWPYVVQLRYF